MYPRLSEQNLWCTNIIEHFFFFFFVPGLCYHQGQSLPYAGDSHRPKEKENSIHPHIHSTHLLRYSLAFYRMYSRIFHRSAPANVNCPAASDMKLFSFIIDKFNEVTNLYGCSCSTTNTDSSTRA